jgi:hypothetical protein
MTELFIRDDDVGELTGDLTRFVSAFASRGLPVSYQIIPARLTTECAQFLLAAERDHPGLIELGQHGLRHEMWLGGRRLKREFGPERSLDEQSADISEGLKILEDHLGRDRPIDVFTPPQHKFDRNTLLAARAAGHRVFSAASYPTQLHRLAYAVGRRFGLSSFRHHGVSYHGDRRPEADLREVSISVVVDDGRSPRLDAARIGLAVAAAAATTDIVGLMFHHAIYDTAERCLRLEDLADALAAHGASHFHLLGALAEPQGFRR